MRRWLHYEVTLVIGTEQDVVHPMAMANELASLIPYASLVRVTAKSENRVTYVSEVRESLRHFLTEVV